MDTRMSLHPVTRACELAVHRRQGARRDLASQDQADITETRAARYGVDAAPPDERYTQRLTTPETWCRPRSSRSPRRVHRAKPVVATGPVPPVCQTGTTPR